MHSKEKQFLRMTRLSVSLGEYSHDSDLLKKRVREIEKQVVKGSSGNIAISPRTVLGNIYSIGLQI